MAPDNIRVPITRPQLGKAEADAVARVVRSHWIIQGPEVAAFETELAAAVGAPHAVAVSSGTSALELSLRVLDVCPGDEVVTVSHSFIATANAIVAVGALPVFVDVEPDTFCMNAALVEAAITPKTKAILCVHQLGFPCDLPAILAIAARRRIPVIEDAACALGSEIELAWDENGGRSPREIPLAVGESNQDDLQVRWERIGRPHGRIACFSFHPRKVITTGDGGMITTTDGALAARLRSLRQHAMTVPPDVRDRDPLAREQFTEPAFNCRMTDLQAAVGRPQLARLDGFLAERRRLAAGYATALEEHPVLAAPVERTTVRANWQSFPTFLRPDGRLKQDDVLRFFFERGIACRRGIHNAHQEPAYAGKANWRSSGPLPVSEFLRDNVVMIPLFHGMTRDEERQVHTALRDLRKTAQ